MNENNLTVTVTDDLCRCCLSELLNLNNYVFKPIENMHIGDAIQDICGIDIYTESTLPDKICDDCLDCLKTCYNFRIRTQQSDRTLHDLLAKSIVVDDYECEEVDTTEDANNSDFILNENVDINYEADDKTAEKANERYQRDDEVTTPNTEQNPNVGEVYEGLPTDRCPYCHKNFLHSKNLRTHIKRHLNEGKYICPHCPNRYHTKFDISRHMNKVHCDGFSFKCDLCEKEFPTKPEWNRHIRSHEELKFFTCSECDMQFRFKHNAQQHILYTHEKRHSFFCQTCGKGFPYACKLRNHERSNCRPSFQISFMKDIVMVEEENKIE